MKSIVLDETTRLEMERQHVAAWSAGIDERLHDCLQRNQGKSVSLTRYLSLLSSVPAERLLIMSVLEMRDLVRQVNHCLPKTNFYRKWKHPSAREALFAQVNKELSLIFDYDAFSRQAKDWNLGTLAMRLKKFIRICPYCNAETVYAYKVGAGIGRNAKGLGRFRILKSSFDHYFPKARYPFLAISLYNLIPSCTRCNTGAKGTGYEELLDVAHPYAVDDSGNPSEDMHRMMKFHVLPRSLRAFSCCEANDISDVVLTERNPSGFSRGVKWESVFGLNNAYTKLYREDAADAMFKATHFSKSYVEALRKQLGAAGLSTDRLEKIVYGARLDANAINVTRHGKMIIDTVEIFQGRG